MRSHPGVQCLDLHGGAVVYVKVTLECTGVSLNWESTAMLSTSRYMVSLITSLTVHNLTRKRALLGTGLHQASQVRLCPPGGAIIGQCEKDAVLLFLCR